MFQHAGTTTLIRAQREPASTPLEEARALIRRYPNLGDIQLARLINLYREFSALDMALVLSDAELAPKLDRFSSEQRSEVRSPLGHYAGLLIYVGLTLAAVAWAIAVA